MQLSVIIPVYNVEKYVARAIESVLQNGFDANRYEIIVVDDESPDNSLAIVNQYVQKYANIRVISQSNKGLGGARNTGIGNATGKYLLFLDADDWYLPDTILHLISEAERLQVEILEFGAQGINPDRSVAYTKSMRSDVLDGINYYQKYRYLDSACNKLYNRDFLAKYDLLFLEKLYIEDYEFNTRAMFKAQKVAAIELIAAQFLQNPESITRNTEHAKHLKMQEDIILVIQKINDFYQRNTDANSAPPAKNYFEQKLAFLTATLFYQLLKRNFAFADLVRLRKRLQQEQLFFVDSVIFDRKKEWFRVVFMRHFALLRIAKGLFKYI